LTEADFEVLAPEHFAVRLTLEEAYRSVHRFLDGNTRQGVVFTHPRFGDYWRGNKMSATEKTDTLRRFSVCSEQLLLDVNRGVTTNRPDPYFTRWAARHLLETGDLIRMGRFVASVPWFKAWQNLEGTDSGFLNDLEILETSAPFPLRVRLSLFRSSILTSRSKISLDLFEQAVRAGIISIPLARAMVWDEQDANVRVLRLKIVSQFAPVPEGDELLAEALRAARGIGDDQSRSGALATLATMLSVEEKRETLAEALQAARRIGDRDRSFALAELALAGLSEYPDLLAEALDTARGIVEEWQRSGVGDTRARPWVVIQISWPKPWRAPGESRTRLVEAGRWWR
jgi:hypothetical protein